MWSGGYGWLLGCVCFAIYLFYRYTQLPDVQNKFHRLVIFAFMPIVVVGVATLGWAVYLGGGLRGIGYILIALFAALSALSLSLYGLKLGIARNANINRK